MGDRNQRHRAADAERRLTVAAARARRQPSDGCVAGVSACATRVRDVLCWHEGAAASWRGDPGERSKDRDTCACLEGRPSELAIRFLAPVRGVMCMRESSAQQQQHFCVEQK